ncbi:radical SAM protein [bacterium AH-315-C08]|nr:radical SAM protein [bacterium AH-315-C08]
MKPKKPPKILIVTTPLRPIPTDFPPLGSLSVITALKKAGFDKTEFYNIDFLRPSFADTLKYIEGKNPDILGISAVVSTAYDYTKKLSLEIKRRLPETTILLGGNLGASAEIILNKTGVEFICASEGERTAIDFANCWMTAETKNDFKKVKGLAFFDKKNEMVVTPFQDSVEAEQVYDIDWSLLGGSEEIDFFFGVKEFAPLLAGSFFKDPRTFEPSRENKRVATLPASKGCVARCTFCHRWDKGIRYIPVSVLMERLDFLIQKYNVGFVSFADENFGTDRKWLAHFTEEVAKRDILWRVSGMRVNTINPELIKKMKQAGCCCIYYGMESGSQKILDVMEKVTKVEQNYNAVKWMAENNLYTIVQLIIGMPGETQKTIDETCKFTSYFVEQSPQTDPNALSINFAQALPGTPLYEIARHKGDIGLSLDSEEEYLLQISDRDARDGETFLNFTEYPRLLLEKWNFDIQIKTRQSYIEKWGFNNYYKVILSSHRFNDLKEVVEGDQTSDSGYFADPARQNEIPVENIRLSRAQASSDSADSNNMIREKVGIEKGRIPSILSLLKQRSIGALATFYPHFFWRFKPLTLIFVFCNCVRKYGFMFPLKLLVEYVGWRLVANLKRQNEKIIPEYISLRKILKKKIFPEIASDNPIMATLRKGR